MNKQYIGINYKIKLFSFLLFFLICSVMFVFNFCNSESSVEKKEVRKLEITAHRGASFLYPENTMSAFVGAKELNADWIELDVQQTKDGKIVVMHDFSLKRTAGVDKRIWELSYDELSKLDVGSYFDLQFKGEKIPLLEEVIKYAKENNIKLNIELKPSGHEKDFEKNVIDIVTALDFKNNCVIASQKYNVLENVKAYDKNITTVYVTGLMKDDISAFKAADHYSIEASRITSELVERIHKEGKKIYAWTVNKEESINRVLNLNVDNIITDNVTLVKDVFNSNRKNIIVSECMKVMKNIFYMDGDLKVIE